MIYDLGTKPLRFFFGKILDARIGIHARFLKNILGRAQTDAINVGKADLDTLVAGKINSCNSSHSVLPPSSLTLFMTRIAAANDANDTIALDHSAIFTNRFNR